MDRRRIEGLRWHLGLTNLAVKDCEGRSGGLAIFWRKGVKFHLRAASRLYIDGEVEDDDGSFWRLTGFYGKPKSYRKELSWSAMRTLNVASAVVRRPCLCLGDFNEILLSHEKEGGLPRPQVCMDRFREALEACGLVDLGFTGDIFTW